MADLTCRCACGNTTKVSEFAVGMMTQCENCGASFRITEKNTRSVEPPKQQAPRIIAAISTADQKPVSGQQQCARCNRPFRGDWDRYYSPAGMVCHVCANLADRVEPMEPAPEWAPVRMPDIPPPIYVPREPSAQPREGKGTLSEQFDDFKQTSTFRMVIWGAAILVMGGALFVHLHDGGFKPPRIQDGQAAEEAPEASPSMVELREALSDGQGAALVILVRALMLFFLFVPNFAALFWALWQAGRLPCYHWWSNALHLGVAAAIMAVPIWAADLLTRQLPFAGAILGLALYGVMYYILYEVYDLYLRDLVMLILVRFLLYLLIVSLQAFVYGGLGLLLT